MFKIIPILVLVLVWSLPASAQGSYHPENREWEASWFGGGSFLGNFHVPTRVLGSDQETVRTVGVHYASGYQVGLRLTKYEGNYWGTDLEYSFANQPVRFTNLSPDIQSLSLSESLHHLVYNVSYYPLKPSQRLRPYVGTGAGTALFHIAGSSKNEALNAGLRLTDSWKFAFNWGGGIKYLAADQFALIFDVKDQITGLPSYGLSRSAQVVSGQFQPGFAPKGFMNNWQLNFGLAFQWDD